MDLAALKGWMAGEDCVIVGCGPSAREWSYEEDEAPRSGGPTWEFTRWTLGCNRSVSWCSPDFAVCVEPWRDKAIWKIIAEANPLIVFSHLESPQHPRAVRVDTKDVRQYLLEGPLNDNPLKLGQCPFVAAAVALYLGFETVGLIGVDYTPERFPDVAPSNDRWERLLSIATVRGQRIVNLNPDSRLETIPKEPWTAIRTK